MLSNRGAVTLVVTMIRIMAFIPVTSHRHHCCRPQPGNDPWVLRGSSVVSGLCILNPQVVPSDIQLISHTVITWDIYVTDLYHLLFHVRFTKAAWGTWSGETGTNTQMKKLRLRKGCDLAEVSKWSLSVVTSGVLGLNDPEMFITLPSAVPGTEKSLCLRRSKS